MTVPRPGAEATSRRPPRAETRSDMFRRPAPSGVLAASNPAPSSVTVKVSVPAAPRSVMATRDAAAYLAMFCSASMQQK